MSNATLLDVASSPNQPSKVIIIIVCLAALTVILNLLYVKVCFQALKKEVSHLLILSLCISDILLGLSFVWFFLSQILTRNNIRSCQFSVFFGSFVLVLTYSLIFMLCLVRYFSVKLYNFGIREKLNRKKYLLVAVVFGFAFLLTAIGTLSFPINYTMESCTAKNLFGKYNLYFVLVVIGTLTVLVVLIVLITLGTTYRFWIIFFKHKNKIIPQNKHSLETWGREQTPESQKETINIIQTNPPGLENTKTSFDKSQSDRNSAICDIIHINLESTDSGVVESPMCSGTNTVQIIGKDNSQYKQPEKEKNEKAWEVKAFFTNVIIASSTVVLTGPFVATYWFDAFSDSNLSQQARLIMFVLCSLNCVINPFVYAWRIPEIRQQFKKVFKIN